MSIKENNFPLQGEIWLINFNILNIDEVIKIRPALVISNNIQNELDRQIIIATITSNKKEFENKADYEVILKSEESNGIDIESKILLNRIQTIFKEHKNRKPFIKKIGSISEEKWLEVSNSLQLVFSKNPLLEMMRNK